MPLDTRAKAKGIPPRGRLPAKGKKAGSNSQNNRGNKRNNKRTAVSETDSNESDDGEESDVAPVVDKKKSSKRRHEESDAEAEVIDDNIEVPMEVEEVDVSNLNAVRNDESEVSMIFC